MAMKMNIVAVCTAGIVLAGVTVASAVPCNCTEELFPQPRNHVGYADSQGHFNLWRPLGEVEFGDDIKLPLRAHFSSDSAGGAVFGYGWTVPLLESTAVPQSETWIDMMTLGGAHVYLVRQKDHSQYWSGDQKWKGEMSSSGILTVTGPKMWQFTYVQGRLTQVKTGDGETLAWRYNGDRAVSVTKVGGRAGTGLEVESSTPGGLPSALLINSQRFPLTFGKMPTVSVDKGVPLVQGFQSSLQAIEKPGKIRETYDFVFLQEGKYQLTQVDFEGKQRVFTWDPATKQLISDGSCTYDVTPNPDAGSEPIVSRRDSKGRVESLFYDGRIGAMVYQGFNGVVTRKHFMLAEGPNYLNLRKVESKLDGKWVTKEMDSYDEHGRLIRSIMGDEVLQKSWYPNGKLASVSREKAGKLIFKRQFNQLGQVTEYDFGPNVVKYAYEGKIKVVQRFLEGKPCSPLIDMGDGKGELVVTTANETGKAVQRVQSAMPGGAVNPSSAETALAALRKVVIQTKAAADQKQPAR